MAEVTNLALWDVVRESRSKVKTRKCYSENYMGLPNL